jgi:hypothetical protein
MIRGRLAARWAAIDARALAVAGLAIAGSQARRIPWLLALLGSATLSRLRSFGAAAGPVLRVFVGEFHAVGLRLVAYGCALGAMGLVAAEFITMPRGSVVAESVPESEWVEIGRPFPAFAMEMPEFDDAARYASWRHAHGGGRKDILTFGNLGSAGATAVVELYRVGGETDATGEPDLTASINELRLSGKPMMPNTIETKFGSVEIDAFTDRAPAGERRCLRFSRSFEEPRFELSGWFCNAGPDMVDRGMVACALDRLSLLSAGSEPKLGALFARAELKRTYCGQNSVFVAATRKRNDWIEAARDPRLRGRQ